MTAPADDELWSAIADPSRRRVLDLLVSNGAVSASWLAGRVPFSRQAVSKHPVVLGRAGLVRRRENGTRPASQLALTAPLLTSRSRTRRRDGSAKPRTQKTRR